MNHTRGSRRRVLAHHVIPIDTGMASIDGDDQQPVVNSNGLTHVCERMNGTSFTVSAVGK